MCPSGCRTGLSRLETVYARGPAGPLFWRKARCCEEVSRPVRIGNDADKSNISVQLQMKRQGRVREHSGENRVLSLRMTKLSLKHRIYKLSLIFRPTVDHCAIKMSWINFWLVRAMAENPLSISDFLMFYCHLYLYCLPTRFQQSRLHEQGCLEKWWSIASSGNRG